MPTDARRTLATPTGWLTIDGDPALVTERVRPVHDAFVADHWPQLAAAAWAGFSRHGAGAVVLWRDASPPVWQPRRPFAPERLWFATQVHTLPGSDRARDFDGWPARQVEAYDPRTEAVVLFVEGRRRRAYRVGGVPGPPEAHRAAQAGLN